MEKSILIILITGIFCNSACNKSKLELSHLSENDSIQMMNRIIANVDICNTFSIDNGFINDTIKEKDKYIIRSTNMKMGHKIVYNMIFSSNFSEDFIIDYNLFETYQNSELFIDGELFIFKNIDFLTNNVIKNADGLFLDIASIREPDAGKIRYYKDNTGDEYIFIKCGLLGCNGHYCNGYYILAIKINKDKKKNITIIDYSYAYPLDFDNMPIFKDKEDKSVNIVLCNAVSDDTVKVNINSYSLFNINNELNKDKNGKLREIDYIYQWGIDTPKIEIKKYNWY